MHGIIFVTWEKYLAERFGNALLQDYRKTIGETASTAPLASRVYDDELLLTGVGAASSLTRLPADTLLREYGRYFITNGLTNHLCAYLLNQVQSGRDLLLTMRNAHAQMRRIPDGLTPPLFNYEAISSDPNTFILIYDSPRLLCSVLHGAIEGAAERYNERVYIVEPTCMKHGAAACRFHITFHQQISNQLPPLDTPEQAVKRKERQKLVNLVLEALPHHNGVTLQELQNILQYWQIRPSQTRPSIMLEALRHLQYAGLVASTANHPGDNLADRRYWRVPTQDNKNG